MERGERKGEELYLELWEILCKEFLGKDLAATATHASSL
jgi:hypothetical protein